MQLLYDSDNFAVVQFEVALDCVGQAPGDNAPSQLTRSGFELVDKLLRKEMFLEGAMAQSFKEGVDALIETRPSAEDVESMYSMFSTPLICSSIGAATARSITSAEAPG